MKITFGGHYSVEEFGDAMDRALQTLKLNGADGITKVTVQLNTTKGNRFLRITEPEDERKMIEHLVYDPSAVAKFKQVHPSIRPADESDG